MEEKKEDGAQQDGAQPMVIRVMDLDVTEPIDFVKPVENLDGRQSLFITMLKRMETMSLTMCMGQVSEGLKERDWLKMKQGVHQLKGASGYVGAGRIHYICYQIQNAFHADDFVKMEGYYPLLVESSIEFKRFSRQYLAKRKGGAYKESGSARNTTVCDGYTLKVNPSDDRIYCLKEGQTIEQRIKEASTFIIKPDHASVAAQDSIKKPEAAQAPADPEELKSPQDDPQSNQSAQSSQSVASSGISAQASYVTHPQDSQKSEQSSAQAAQLSNQSAQDSHPEIHHESPNKKPSAQKQDVEAAAEAPNAQQPVLEIDQNEEKKEESKVEFEKSPPNLNSLPVPAAENDPNFGRQKSMLADTPQPRNAKEKRELEDCLLEQEKFIQSSKKLDGLVQQNKVNDLQLNPVNSQQQAEAIKPIDPPVVEAKAPILPLQNVPELGDEVQAPAPVPEKAVDINQVGVQGNQGQGNQVVQNMPPPLPRMPYVANLVSENQNQDELPKEEVVAPKKEELVVPIAPPQARPESPRVQEQPPIAGPIQIIDTTQKKDERLIQQDADNQANQAPAQQLENQPPSPKIADNSVPLNAQEDGKLIKEELKKEAPKLSQRSAKKESARNRGGGALRISSKNNVNMQFSSKQKKPKEANEQEEPIRVASNSSKKEGPIRISSKNSVNSGAALAQPQNSSQRLAGVKSHRSDKSMGHQRVNAPPSIRSNPKGHQNPNGEADGGDFIEEGNSAAGFSCCGDNKACTIF